MVSWDSSEASFPLVAGMNSILILRLGKRYRSSSQGFPTTSCARILRKGLNHGLIGCSFKCATIDSRFGQSKSMREDAWLKPSISRAVFPSAC